MEAVAHNPSFAKKAGVPQKVGKDFAKADKASNNYMKSHKKAKGSQKRGRGSNRG